MADLHVNDIGTELEFTVTDGGVVVDLSTLTALTLRFKPPGQALRTKTLGSEVAYVTDGTDGTVKYTVESGFLDVAGTYQVQAFINFDASNQYYSSIVSFAVDANLS